MKNYKFLVPIVMVALFAASVYMLYSTKADELNQYNQFLENARNYRSQEIYTDAKDNYISALNMKPSLELYIEIGEMFRDADQMRDAINWGNTIILNYPKEVKGYEFLMSLYIQRNDYVACFTLNDTLAKRKLSSQTIDEWMSEIEYTYYFNGEYVDVGIYSGGLCPVLVGDQWGYVDLTGDKVISNQFVKVGYFSGDLSPVVDRNGNAFFIDQNGNKKKVVQGVENLKELGLIENDLFSLYNGSTWGFYNSNNEHVFGNYEDTTAIGNGIAAVKENGKWSIVNRDGTDLTGSKYDRVACDEKQVVYRNDRLFVYYDMAYHLIDSTGAVITDQTFQDARVFNDSTYAAVRINDKWGFIDKDGNIVIEPQYEAARSFSNGFAAVQYAGKWGFIDQEGKMVIEPTFDNAKDFNSNGCVFVLEYENWKLLRLYKYNH